MPSSIQDDNLATAPLSLVRPIQMLTIEGPSCDPCWLLGVPGHTHETAGQVHHGVRLVGIHRATVNIPSAQRRLVRTPVLMVMSPIAGRDAKELILETLTMGYLLNVLRTINELILKNTYHTSRNKWASLSGLKIRGAGSQGSLECSCGSIKFLQGAQKCTV